MQGAVARQARGPGITCDLGTNGGRPGLDQRGHPGGRAEAPELAPDGIADAIHHAARTRPGETSSNWAGSNGSEEAWVAVTSVWPAA